MPTEVVSVVVRALMAKVYANRVFVDESETRSAMYLRQRDLFLEAVNLDDQFYAH